MMMRYRNGDIKEENIQSNSNVLTAGKKKSEIKRDGNCSFSLTR